jgi:D-Tyr-tRNA(Tyr) deacylase
VGRRGPGSRQRSRRGHRTRPGRTPHPSLAAHRAGRVRDVEVHRLDHDNVVASRSAVGGRRRRLLLRADEAVYLPVAPRTSETLTTIPMVPFSVMALQYPVHTWQQENTRKGNRPSFTGAALPRTQSRSTTAFARRFPARTCPLERGIFGAGMPVELVNDGPVTIVLNWRPELLSSEDHISSCFSEWACGPIFCDTWLRRTRKRES